MFKVSLILFLLFLCNIVFDFADCQEQPKVFLTAAKSVPRIGRSNKGNSEFEKFFLKASKSVPRIGRRNEVNVFFCTVPNKLLFNLSAMSKFIKKFQIIVTTKQNEISR